MMSRLRLRTLRSTEARGPDPARVIRHLLPLLYTRRTLLLVPVSCPSPAPAPHWRTAMCSRDAVPLPSAISRTPSGASQLFAPTRYPLHRPSLLEPGPSPMALGGRLPSGAGDGRDTVLTRLLHSPTASLCLGPRTSVKYSVGEIVAPCPCSTGPSPTIPSTPSSVR
jgi:hypothetical protein